MSLNHTLPLLEEQAWGRFHAEWMKLGFSEADYKEATDGLRFLSIEEQERQFSNIVLSLMKKGIGVNEMERMNGLVRAFQGLVNHEVVITGAALPTSQILQHIITDLTEFDESKFVDTDILMERLLDAHLQIDRVLERVSEKLLIEGIAHHVLDWYAQEDPIDFFKRDVDQLAAVSIFILIHFNSPVYKNTLTIKQEDLAIVEVPSAFYSVVYGVVDPNLLLIDPLNKPNDWVEQIRTIAPDFLDFEGRQHAYEQAGAPEDFLFDDCPVCQAQRDAMFKGRAPTESELKEAFKKAKEQGGIVGGAWFEKNKDNDSNV